MAARCGLEATYISQVEGGFEGTSLTVLIELAEELGVRASILVAEIEDR